jgi:hypothetical protein
MKEGAWINANTFEFFWVDDHSRWIKEPENAKKLGIPSAVAANIAKMPNDFNGPLREKILLAVMASGPFVRVRGHGNVFVFEFICTTSTALWGCYGFLKQTAGPYTNCLFNNIRTKESIELYYKDFEERMQEDESKILRMAKAIPKEAFLAELLNPPKE